MFEDLVSFIKEDPEARYRLIVGTDSQEAADETVFVTAVIIHREGKGARYYYQRRRQPWVVSLRQRIFWEASLSLSLAGMLAERLAGNGVASLDVEIHLDVGTRGETRELIRELVGMIAGSGFDAKIKPESYGASKVADKHTK
jgi:predicted RNase H-related nuclease YkuK (DUF458 family)